MEEQSQASGKGSGKGSVAFSLKQAKAGKFGASIGKKGMNDSVRSGDDKGNYGAPTMKMLNPALYAEMEKNEKQSKDPIFTSVRQIKERYSYHEIRVNRISKRSDEVTKELEALNEEEIKKKRAKQMQQ